MLDMPTSTETSQAKLLFSRIDLRMYIQWLKESCLPWQNDSEGIVSECPVCNRIHNVIACNKTGRGTVPIHVSTKMHTLDALHRETGIELIEALSSSNGATINVYDIANCKMATFQNDARRTTQRCEVEAQTRRTY